MSQTLKVKIDFHEELGHGLIYIHVDNAETQKSIFSLDTEESIRDLIESGFFDWDNEDQLITYLKSVGIIDDISVKVVKDFI